MTEKIKITPDPHKAMSKFKDDIRKATLSGMEKGLIALHEKIPGPPMASKKPFQFTSIKQQRWFFKALKSGNLQIPYKRKNDMLRRMTTSANLSGPTNVIGRIGTPVWYAPYVISDRKIPDGRGPQSGYHKGTWWTLQDEVEKHIEVVVDKIRDVVKDI